MSKSTDNEAEHELISTSLELEKIDANLYRSKSLYVPRRARGVFGGQVISQALVAATGCVDAAFHLHSLHCYFLLSVSSAIPVLYYVERIREGRTYTTRSVKAAQSGKIVFIMLCSYQKPELFQPIRQVIFPQNVPAPEDVMLEEERWEQLAAAPGTSERAKAELSLHAQDRRGSPIAIAFAKEVEAADGSITFMWWMKARKGRGMPDRFEASFQKCILAYISDHQFISTIGRTLRLPRVGQGRSTMTSSLDHSIFYYSSEFDCSEWMLYVMSAPVIGNGRGVITGQMFTREGTLIAVITQEGVTRVGTRPATSDSAPQPKL